MTIQFIALLTLFTLCLAVVLATLVGIVAAALVCIQRSIDRWTRRYQIRAQDYGTYHYPWRK